MNKYYIPVYDHEMIKKRKEDRRKLIVFLEPTVLKSRQIGHKPHLKL